MPHYVLTYHELNEVVFDEVEAESLQDAENKIRAEDIPYEEHVLTSELRSAIRNGKDLSTFSELVTQALTPGQIGEIKQWVQFGLKDDSGIYEAREALNGIERILQNTTTIGTLKT
jgi:hypothetical protein